MHMQTRCGLPSITDLLSPLANKFVILSALHVQLQVSLVINAAVNHFSVVDFKQLQKSKNSVYLL